jgi:hypothetical protein
MTSHIRFLIAMALALTSLPAAVFAERTQVRGLDFRAYLSLQRGMTEGQVLGIAGKPDLLADQGVAYSDSGSAQRVREPERTVLAVRTYTYLPTAADPYTTGVTLVGGRVTDIRRDETFDSFQTTNPHGLDFGAYLSLKHGMTEGQLLSVAGKPDVLADQGAAFSDRGPTQELGGSDRIALSIRTYTYLPTQTDPETTTVTFVGGWVTEIRRDKKF